MLYKTAEQVRDELIAIDPSLLDKYEIEIMKILKGCDYSGAKQLLSVTGFLLAGKKVYMRFIL